MVYLFIQLFLTFFNLFICICIYCGLFMYIIIFSSSSFTYFMFQCEHTQLAVCVSPWMYDPLVCSSSLLHMAAFSGRAALVEVMSLFSPLFAYFIYFYYFTTFSC